ncbi:MAG: acylphosphatase [Candidatus Riflebacteria bacterium]|nr:acylphosphatase [Candidatus Riflebacteria bacterium]
MLLKNRYIVYGRVQGVGFRRFVLRCADEYSVGGWVKNRPDGNVELEAIGTQAELSGFLEKVAQGSWFSNVEEIEELASSQIDIASRDFRIVRG